MASKLKEEIPVAFATVNKYETPYEPELNFNASDRDLSAILKRAETQPNSVSGSILHWNQKERKAKSVNMGGKELARAFKENNRKFREYDSFDSTTPGGASGLFVGDDFVPLLGGPFNKQQYLQDYLQGQAQAFFAYHHDPFARAAGNITKHFTLGRGYRADSEDKGALAIWAAFERANNMQDLLAYVALELFVQGEVMVYWIPDKMAYVSIDNPKQLSPSKCLLPRVRLLDTSAIWEVITLPEDIQAVFAYQQVYISQYQSYTTSVDGAQVPGSKTVIRQIPAEEVDHWKTNCLSGEKRGRSDLYPVLGFLKRLRDIVQYSIIQKQKQAAYSFDVTIEGSDADLQAYASTVQAQGQMPQAGSEFIHTAKVKRELQQTSGGSSGEDGAFEWCLSCIAAGLGIPVSYFGTHISGGQTRASAMISTEPSTKKFEDRQELYKQILHKMAQRLFKMNGIEAEIEFTFPELITQDRSAKFKDLQLAQESGWISKQRAAEIAAKELGIKDFKFDQEVTEEKPEVTSDSNRDSPLSNRPRYAGVTSQDRKQVKDAVQ